MSGKKARIIGTGSYLPEKVLTNKDLEKLVETTDEWIVSRTGMKERRIAAEDEYTSNLATKAALEAIKDASINVEDIDLILLATLTPDYTFPSTACLVQDAIKAKCPALDIQAACSGFVYALSIAKAYIESGMYKNILLIAAEKLSAITDYEDRSTCVLFGDGAAACVVSDKGPGLVINDTDLGSDGCLGQLLYMPAGGSREPASIETVKDRKHFIKMNGREVFKNAVRRMETASVNCLKKANLTEDQISYIVPHQANERIIQALAKRFQVPMDRVYLTLQKYGNTSASSCGIALDEFMKKFSLKDKENILMVAFGAGLTWGAGVLTYIKE